MENTNNQWFEMSDPALLVMLGEFLQQERLQQNKTQQQVASVAGINRSTLVQFENGNGGTLLSFIQILRALEQLPLLQHFTVPAPAISPMLLAKMEQRKRLRARSTTKISTPKSNW